MLPQGVQPLHIPHYKIVCNFAGLLGYYNGCYVKQTLVGLGFGVGMFELEE